MAECSTDRNYNCHCSFDYNFDRIDCCSSSIVDLAGCNLRPAASTSHCIQRCRHDPGQVMARRQLHLLGNLERHLLLLRGEARLLAKLELL